MELLEEVCLLALWRKQKTPKRCILFKEMYLWHRSILQVLWWHLYKVDGFPPVKSLRFRHLHTVEPCGPSTKCWASSLKEKIRIHFWTGKIKKPYRIVFFILRQTFFFTELNIICNKITLWISCVYPSGPSGYFCVLLELTSIHWRWKSGFRRLKYSVNLTVGSRAKHTGK